MFWVHLRISWKNELLWSQDLQLSWLPPMSRVTMATISHKEAVERSFLLLMHFSVMQSTSWSLDFVIRQDQLCGTWKERKSTELGSCFLIFSLVSFYCWTYYCVYLTQHDFRYLGRLLLQIHTMYYLLRLLVIKLFFWYFSKVCPLTI